MDMLNIGAGHKALPGAVNHDRWRHSPEIDVEWDLNERPWPWADNSFDLIVACAVLEHLRINLVESLDECWRILRPGGVIRLKVPYWNHDAAWQDVTHYWQFSLHSFDQFDPATKRGHDYAFYGMRQWKIVKGARLNQGGTSIIVTMQVRK